MNGRERLRKVTGVALVLSVVLVCLPALAIDSGARQKLPPQEEKALYERSDLRSETGVTELPGYIPAPVIIDPGGNLLDFRGAPDLGGAAIVLGGSGPSGGLDAIASAEHSMRKIIRRLD